MADDLQVFPDIGFDFIDVEPFVDPEGYHAFIDRAEDHFREALGDQLHDVPAPWRMAGERQ